MDYAPLIDRKRQRFAEIEAQLSSPDFFNDPKKAADCTREHSRLKQLLETWEQYTRTQAVLAGNQELAKETDPELAEMAAAEIPALEKSLHQLDERVTYSLLPPDGTEDRDALLEIRAGTGGDEASLFAADLLRMYTRYCDTRGWRIETLDSSPSDVGGFKSITLKVSGDEVFRFLRYESGVHRVQRVPATETQGRIHTSTATVAVLPEAEEVDVQIRPEDIEVQASRAGGPGGQGVNTTDSAVQIFHKPSGLVIRCIETRSQIKNRERAMAILRAKLFEAKQREEQEKYATHRRSLIGSGGREEKIRTYNYPQNRVTDHRIGLTLYNLDLFVEGQIDEMVVALQRRDMEERMAALQDA
ncbi:MAG: peptide chain release factor 1 [Verrucomicrobiales bacterium]